MKQTACWCFLAAAALSSALAGAKEDAECWVRGQVVFDGAAPKSPIPDDAGVHREILEIDSETQGLLGVLVFLTPVRGHPPGEPEKAADALAPIVIDQQDYAFVPRVVAVRARQPVTFTNSDAANHNVRTVSLTASNEFNVYTGIGGEYQHRFSAQPKQRPIQLGCDIHPWMRGWIYVFDHSLFSVSDRKGAFQIGPLAPGEYTLSVRQPDLRYAQDHSITVAPAQLPLKLRIRSEDLPRKPE